MPGIELAPSRVSGGNKIIPAIAGAVPREHLQPRPLLWCSFGLYSLVLGVRRFDQPLDESLGHCFLPSQGSCGGSDGKRLPEMWETHVRSLGWEDPLEKEMATHSSILAWRIPQTEEPGGLWSMGLQRVEHD